MRIGIVGLPNVGKSTLFNALTGGRAVVDIYPFTTVDANVGVVAVPDERLARLGELLKPRKLTPARVEFIDIAGLVEGASRGEGLGNQFLAKVREVDGIVHVLRCFTGDVAHVSGRVDPVRDLGIIRTELAIADLEVVDRRLDRLRGAVKRGDRTGADEVGVLEKVRGFLSSLSLDELRRWAGGEEWLPADLPLLSTKPVIFVLNVPEEWAADPLSAEWPREAIEAIGGEGPVVPISVKLEAELVEMPEGEEEAFRKDLRMEPRPIDRLIREGAKLLRLITFYTIKGEETRGWLAREGTTALSAAGMIHSDLERGFIKAEVVPCGELFSAGGMAKARELGKVAIEGREYRLRDGDVLWIHFRV